MACRYKVARARGQAQYDAVVEEDRQLLETFGAGLLSTGGGVRVYLKAAIRNERINPWDVIEIGPKVWSLIRPVMAEVKELRAWKAERLRRPTTRRACELTLHGTDRASAAAAAK
jgi:hypothetical protein